MHQIVEYSKSLYSMETIFVITEDPSIEFDRLYPNNASNNIPTGEAKRWNFTDFPFQIGDTRLESYWRQTL